MSMGFKSVDTMNARIDALPQGPNWQCTTMHVKGDLVDENGVEIEDYLDLWHRNPVEVVAELLGNPDFSDQIVWSSEKRYRDAQGRVQEYKEMSSGNWWWDVQVCHLRSSAKRVLIAT